jgi:tRNA (cytidine32/uridine32-2'-O)-methyltransferase
LTIKDRGRRPLPQEMQIPVRIVLVEPSHPGNIGASARAMKTMGLYDLTLVAPKHFPSEEATARAAGADDVLAQACLAPTLVEAIGDCGLVVGATARLRNMRWPVVDPRQCAEAIWQHVERTKVAIVMGPEQSGLTNTDLGRCQLIVHIPTDPAFGSLNLAMAVQVLCYELRMAKVHVEQPAEEHRSAPLASAAELEGFHLHLERVLADAGFLHHEHQRQLKLKLRRLFHRARLDQNEVNILRGALAALDPVRRSVDEQSP